MSGIEVALALQDAEGIAIRIGKNLPRLGTALTQRRKCRTEFNSAPYCALLIVRPKVEMEGTVALAGWVRVVACLSDSSSLSPLYFSVVCGLPVPARRGFAGGPLVSPLRLVVPRC